MFGSKKKEDEPKKDDEAKESAEDSAAKKEDETKKSEDSKKPTEPTGPESLGFGFINFATHEAAAAAVAEI